MHDTTESSVLMLQTRSMSDKHGKNTKERSQNLEQATSSLYASTDDLNLEVYNVQFTSIATVEFYEELLGRYSSIKKTFFFIKKIIVFWTKLKYKLRIYLINRL